MLSKTYDRSGLADVLTKGFVAELTVGGGLGGFMGVVRQLLGSQRYLSGDLPAKIQIQNPLIHPPYIPLPGYTPKVPP